MTSAQWILVVEDNQDDAYFMRRALKAAAPSCTAQFVGDGREALNYLRGNGDFGNRTDHPFPDIVFLDLKIPIVHGLDVLAAIRADPQLKPLRVFILTSSAEERDRKQAESLGIDAYLVKPPSPDMLQKILAPAGSS